MSPSSPSTEVANSNDLGDEREEDQMELENMLGIEIENVDIHSLVRPPSPTTSEHLPAESELEENQLGIDDLTVDGDEQASGNSSASTGSTTQSANRNFGTQTASTKSKSPFKTAPKHEFVLFDEFPKEIRDMIWKASANVPSTIHMVVTQGGFNFIPPYSEIPAVLLVNKESRAIALRAFEQMRASPFYRPSGWIINQHIEGVGPVPGLATSGVDVHSPVQNLIAGQRIRHHCPPNQPRYSTGVLLYLQGSHGYTATPPLEENPIVPGLAEAFNERMRQHWARVTPKFWVNFQSDIFKLTFPDYNLSYPCFRLQPTCYPNFQWSNRPLLPGSSLKPRLSAFLWTQDEPVPGFWSRIRLLALDLGLDHAHSRNHGLEFSIWSRNAVDDFCTHFVASIRTKFPNLNRLSFVVALDPTAPQLHGRPHDRMELRPLRFVPLVHGNGPTWEGRARLQKLELDIKAFYWNEFGATDVHDNIELVVEVPGSVVRGKH